MFCGKCGAKLNDGAAFCTNCGASQGPTMAQPVTANAAPEVTANNKNRKIGIIAVAVAIALLISLCCAVFGGRGYKATVNKYIKAQFAGDIEDIVDLMPKKVFNYALEQEGYDKSQRKEFIQSGQAALTSYVTMMKAFYGEKMKVSHKITEVEAIKGDDLKELKSYYKEIGVKVSAAKEITVDITIKGNDMENTSSSEFTVIKVGGSWYIDALISGLGF